MKEREIWSDSKWLESFHFMIQMCCGQVTWFLFAIKTGNGHPLFDIHWWELTCRIYPWIHFFLPIIQWIIHITVNMNARSIWVLIYVLNLIYDDIWMSSQNAKSMTIYDHWSTPKRSSPGGRRPCAGDGARTRTTSTLHSFEGEPDCCDLLFGA